MLPISRCRLRASFICLLVGVLALGPACSEDDSTSPDLKVPISTLGPRLVIEPESGPIGTVFQAKVVLGAGEESDLDGYSLYVFGPEELRRTSNNADAAEGVGLQIGVPGNHTLQARVYPPVGSSGEALELSAPLEVTFGSGDGSQSWIEIPPGEFLQGVPEGEGAFTSYHPQRQVWLDWYWIGRTEVTNARFLPALEWAVRNGKADLQVHEEVADPVRRIVTRGDFVHVVIDLNNSDYELTEDGLEIAAGKDLYPVRGVSWYGAAYWCNWMSQLESLELCYTDEWVELPPGSGTYILVPRCDVEKRGYRLPTEAEWEKAARGGLALADGANPIPDRWYPWGNEPPAGHGDISAHANIFELYMHTTPVGSFPAGKSPYGLEDMVGNVAEWTNDWFDSSYYDVAPSEEPLGPEYGETLNEDAKTWRGNPYFDTIQFAETGCSFRWGRDAHDTPASLGFRVVRSR